MNHTEEAFAIPHTTPRRYISGVTALNVISDDGTGDWHAEQFLHGRPARRPRTFLVGEGTDFDTTALLGEEGIYDCAPMLDRMGIPHPPGAVWAANHARAISDLVIAAVTCGEDPIFVPLDDWMPRPSDKARVAHLLERASKAAPEHALALGAWLAERLHD